MSPKGGWLAMAWLLTGASLTHASSPPQIAKPLTADYLVYSGTLADQRPATQADRKLAIDITAQAAKEIFDAIGPDAGITCSGERGERLRRKKNLWCMYRPDSGYRCFIGIDLRTGMSIPGGSC